jgi:hypothetical protein
MRALVFTKSAFTLARSQPGKWWVSIAGAKPGSLPDGLCEWDDGTIACYWTPTCNLSSSLIVIGCPEIFGDAADADAETAVQRIAKLMRAGMDGGRLPPDYGPFRHGNKSSAFAYSYNVSKKRVVAEARSLGTNHFYVCVLGASEAWELAKFTPDYDLFRAACELARSHLPASIKGTSSPNIDLDAVYGGAGDDIGLRITWQHWYDRQVNSQQKEFIDLAFEGPIRLRGGPGTGKTLTLALKALKTLDDARTAGTGCRILFLTHSWSLAEAVDELLGELDPGAELRRNDRSLDVWPLLTLADQGVKIGATSRRLLGPDSRAGKLEMFRRLENHLDDYLQGDWIARRSGCRTSFIGRLEADRGSVERRVFVWDVLNEIATVFAAAGLHPRKRTEYLRLPRRKYMMDLASATEKEVIVDLYKAYFEGLLRDGLTGPEQLISDYLKMLGTFEWERMRKTEGFDSVFVDETHLFDEQEMFVLHQLLADPDRSPRVAMAMDPKQSPIDVFVNVQGTVPDSAEVYRRANLPSPKKLELTITFRHTRAIAELVRTLVEQNMLLGLGDEWDTPTAMASDSVERGTLPLYTVHNDRAEQFRYCFDRAKHLARQGKPRKVAVICMDAERFDDYSVSVPAQYGDSSVVISSQEDMIDALRYSSRRFALSLPDYVGGLQFDVVLVIDANDDETKDDVNQFQRRRFLTDLYVACSRAKSHLEIHSTKDRGGLSGMLKRSVAQGLIVSSSS